MDNHKYMLTYTGKKIYFDNIQEDNICIQDIAHHLARTVRYSGTTDWDVTYSVAEHSILMACYACEHYDEYVARACLFHDASEAYLGDVNSALKPLLKEYLILEESVQTLIHKKFGIYVNEEIMGIVHELDKRILLNEVRVLFPDRYGLYLDKYKGLKPLFFDQDNMDDIMENVPDQQVSCKFYLFLHQLLETYNVESVRSGIKNTLLER